MMTHGPKNDFEHIECVLTFRWFSFLIYGNLFLPTWAHHLIGLLHRFRDYSMQMFLRMKIIRKWMERKSKLKRRAFQFFLLFFFGKAGKERSNRVVNGRKKKSVQKLKYSQVKWNKSFGNNNKPIILWVALSFWQKLHMPHADRCWEWECSIYFFFHAFMLLYSSCAAKCVALIVGSKIIIEKCIVTLFIISCSYFTLRFVYFDWINFLSDGIHLFRWYFASFGQRLPIIIIIIIAIEAYCVCVCVVGSLSRIVHQ